MYGISDSLLALLFLGVLLILSKFGQEMFERIKLVPYVGAIIFGIIIGPGVLGLVKVIPNISLFISIGINFLLFAGGALEFKNVETKDLLNGKNIFIGVSEFILPFTFISIIMYYIFHSFLLAAIAGLIAGMSSAGPLTRLLSDTGLNKTDEGNKIFQQVVTMEISAVILFSFISDLHGKTITFFNIFRIAIELFLAIFLIILFSKYVLTKMLYKIDSSYRVHETVIAVIISFVFILGFVGQLYGFNSAIVALFIGILLRDFINERPIVAEKVSTITYGFFEPLFFVGLGLYFVKITIPLILLGLVIFIAGLAFKPLSGLIASKFTGVSAWKNSFGTSVHGGVDSALLVLALSLGLLDRYNYSAIMIGITLLTLVIPFLFTLRAPLVPIKKSNYIWEMMNLEFKNLKACDIAGTFQSVSVNKNNPISLAFKMCTDLNSRAVIVINTRSKVLGQLRLSDMVTLGEDKLKTLQVSQGDIVPALKVKCDSPATELIKLFREYDPPIVAVVDQNGRFIGTILEREILKHISTILEEK